jgi:hypothetical protein
MSYGMFSPGSCGSWAELASKSRSKPINHRRNPELKRIESVANNDAAGEA